MAEAKVASNKKSQQRVRKLNGLVVRTVFYNGRASGHGNYFAGYVDDPAKKGTLVSDMMIVDESGRPVPYSAIGQLDWA